MNNRDMMEFAKYFSHGVESGVNNYQKAQQTAIAAQRNAILERDRQAMARDRARRTDIYGTSVENQGILARARAQKAPQAKALIEKYGREGADMSPPPPAAGTNVTVQAADDGGGNAINPPADEGMAVPEQRKGGMVKKFAYGGFADARGGGGISGDMSLEEAAQGGPGGKGSKGGDATQGANMFASTFKLPSGSGGIKDKWGGTPQNIPGYGTVTATGPQGTGAGGSYTPADVGEGSAAFGPMRTGGMVRRFARGGVVQAIDTGTSGPGSGFGTPAAPPLGAPRATPTQLKRGSHG
jgi:hypothetical protein